MSTQLEELYDHTFVCILHVDMNQVENCNILYIRRGHDDLGDHYLDCGDLSNALKCYSRARDYCTSAKHVINMCLNVIKVCLRVSHYFFLLTDDKNPRVFH